MSEFTFSPSLVDLDKWIMTREASSPILEQILLQAELAQRMEASLIFPFAPFCPLRAALEREREPQIDPLRNVKIAVLKRGFMGIKLYPTMGFRPMVNRHRISWAPEVPTSGSSSLDRELHDLYVWCIENDVPIMAHANNSMAAGINTGHFAHPLEWGKLLSRNTYSELRVNLAHFGGFSETLAGDGPDWEDDIATLTAPNEGIHFDLGYGMELANASHTDHAHVVGRENELFSENPLLHDRIMYGSDWP